MQSRKWGSPRRRRLQPRIAALAMAAVAAVTGVSRGQSNQQIIGLTTLLSLDPTLTGSGVTVGQAEADVNGTGTNSFEVSPAYVGQPASLFTYYDDNGNVTTSYNSSQGSAHANNVGALFYGTTGSGVATGVAHVDNYSADYFAGTIISNLVQINDAVVNESFIFAENADTPLTVSDQEETDTAYDNYIDEFGTIIVSAIGNAGAFPNPNAPGTAYNGIGVAAYPGPVSVGPTIDNFRSKPDITAPGTATSYTTPLVSGAAAILVQAGARGDGGSSAQTEQNAVDSRTVKALLLNGANKQSVHFSRTPVAPLDPVNGSGMLNVYNAYEQLVGGQQTPTQIDGTAALGAAHPAISSGVITAPAGWDFDGLTSSATSDAYANYVFQPTQNSLTATIDWNRQLNLNPNILSLGINNLDLFLYDATANRLLDWSDSVVDNVQDIYDTNLIPGDVYDLQVLKVGGAAGVTSGVISDSETYALAYSFAAAPTGAIVQSAVWNSAATGSWTNSANWYNGLVPGQAQQTANFTDAITGPTTVTLNQNFTVGEINFDSANAYTIAPGTSGSLTLDNGGASAAASITDSGGSHFITAPVALNSSAIFTVGNAGDTLTISGPISGGGSLTTAGAGTLTLSGSNTYTGSTTARSGTLVIGAASAVPSGNALTVGTAVTTATARLAPGIGAVQVSSLTINSGSTLDITNNELVINYGSAANDPASTIRGYLTSGYGLDTWTGPGISSSAAATNAGLYAVGYADGNVDAGTPAQANQVVVKYTLAGDANLDGIVNFADLLVVAQNFNRSNSNGNPIDWADGDFNYDNTVNFADLLLVAQNFNKTLTASQLAQVPQSFSADWNLALAEVQNSQTNNVPEPASVGVMAMAAAGLLARRRRRGGR
ncbi:MAG: autotransporter-associated beta strand repeat-containing protein [Tepidisphaeraceae bacterium]